MSNNLPLHPLNTCWDLAASAVRAEALDAALELKLFDALTEPSTAAELAARRDLHPLNTSHLLELLWSMGLLRRQRHDAEPDLYELSATAREFLVREAPGYCGDAWRYRLTSLRGMASRLRAHVQQGPQLPQSAFQSATGAGWAAAARAQIGQEQRTISAAGALSIVGQLPQAQASRRLLDLGGGPGWIAIELARHLPNLSGVVFDWPETALVAQENIDSSGLSRRLSAQGGDVAVDSLGENYDLVWCSSVLHFVPDIQAVLAKVMAAMAPGGLFIFVHAELPPTAEEAARVMPFYLPMRMVGRHVVPEGTTAALMADAGFIGINSFASGDFPMSPVQVVVGRKPQASERSETSNV
ncbi:class I SAM-dependent methyltransferase [Ottowia thiooxydans]|uniref:class I SAM-dependent methyltransferase n=1 Tax=Ottowia thiooxydans TaxID=219182 RepID=UPI000427D92D|nr:class I SAM-dependent methyltransferase [Ottowia thiooxydans]